MKQACSDAKWSDSEKTSPPLPRAASSLALVLLAACAPASTPTPWLAAPLDGALVATGPADIVVVLDVTTPISQSQLNYNAETASAFVRVLGQANPPLARLGLVILRENAQLAVPLTSDFSQLTSALAPIKQLSGTAQGKLEDALTLAGNELVGSNSNPVALPVVLVISGNQVPDDFRARLSAAGGVLVHAATPGQTVPTPGDGETAFGFVTPAALASAQAGALLQLSSTNLNVHVTAPPVTAAAVSVTVTQGTTELAHATHTSYPFDLTVPLPADNSLTRWQVTATAVNSAGVTLAQQTASMLAVGTNRLPVVTSVEPILAHPGEMVTIQGLFFSGVVANDNVVIGAASTKPVTATKNQIVFALPAGATDGSLVVQLASGESTPATSRVDSDDDELADNDELRIGTDPHNPDTDTDGFLDGLDQCPLSKPGRDGMLLVNSVGCEQCENGMRDPAETDVDCGGRCFQTCPAGENCDIDQDCTSHACYQGTCEPDHCTDGMLDDGEVDVDCGGTCAPCATGLACGANTDCASSLCRNGTCDPATCADHVQDGTETGVDCGSVCGPCPDGDGCTAPTDCIDGVCGAGFCAAPTCSDGVKNGQETAVDCGGPSCPGCGSGSSCSSGTDCQSLLCTGGRCATPTCTDHVKNGQETDVDCGGPSCLPCGLARGCTKSTDCTSSTCIRDVCAPSTCTSGTYVPGIGESDVDCGGPCQTCATGQNCFVASDCGSSVCSNGRCATPSCADGVRNGSESDLDCGGSCRPCGNGKDCVRAEDCTSLDCGKRGCVPGTCGDGLRDGDETGVDCGGSCDACPLQQDCTSATDCQSGVCDGVCVLASCSASTCGGSCAPCATGLDCRLASDCASEVCKSGACAASSCSDGVMNGNESDVDCGGSCPACGDRATCLAGTDCASQLCAQGLCLPAACNNGTQSPGETDVDCGGPCLPCQTGDKCAVAGDCQSGSCSAGICQGPSCNDGVKNGTETDVDCGGVCPTRCRTDQGCRTPTDCVEGVCANGRCAPPSCGDGVCNGTETDVDCGGSACSPCPAAEHCSGATDCLTRMCAMGAPSSSAPPLGILPGPGICISASCTADECGGDCAPCSTGGPCSDASDCASGVCSSNHCAAPSCSDGVQNGAETALDCGGTCTACAVGEHCTVGHDCVTGACIAGSCATPTCTDGVQDGSETAVDCGGSCHPCPAEDTCLHDSDCSTTVCLGDVCTVPSCSDLIKDGTETAVDCGGTCSPCGPGKGCKLASDCTSDVCTVTQGTGMCALPTCHDHVKNGDETDVDCGGTCPVCPTGDQCNSSMDCANSYPCVSGTGGVTRCTAPTCTDGIQDGQETGIDCGGTCPACLPGSGCDVPHDCTSGICAANGCGVCLCDDGTCATGPSGVCDDLTNCLGGPDAGPQPLFCAEPTCFDNVQNGAETGIDCGGGTCAPCQPGSGCKVKSDCVTVCTRADGGTSGTCAEPTCTDGVRDGTETAIDCGGLSCSPCPPGDNCDLSHSCTTGVCAANGCTVCLCDDGTCATSLSGACDDDTNCLGAPDAGPQPLLCAQPTCFDNVPNGAETGMDCGGGTCPACPSGSGCKAATDCVSLVCTDGGTSGTCAVPSCTDRVRNGMETAVDCGGSCPGCSLGETCKVATDCASHLLCYEGSCVANLCSDTFQDGTETGVDCGGACSPCAAGAGCRTGDDCATGFCSFSAVSRPDGGLPDGSTPGRCELAPSCEVIQQNETSPRSGVYSLLPQGASEPVSVYCDESTDNGGWTLVASAGRVAPADQAAAYSPSLQTLSPDGGAPGVWDGLRAQTVQAPADVRFACKADVTDPANTVDLSFYSVAWYDVITRGADSDSCFNVPGTPPEPNQLSPYPARQNNLTGAILGGGTPWAGGALQGEISCADTTSFTVDFDNAGLNYTPPDPTEWGMGYGISKCGTATSADGGVSHGAWFVWVREPFNTCFNNVQDNGETGLDCGGSCKPCPIGQGCNTGNDCTTGYCPASTCVVAPTCAAILGSQAIPTSGAYPLLPAGASAAVTVYCDEITDNGGWTLVAASAGVAPPDRGSTTTSALGSLSPTGASAGVWNGLSEQIGGAPTDIRFSCRLHATDSNNSADLSIYQVGWYADLIHSSTTCFDVPTGDASSKHPARQDNLTSDLIPSGSAWSSSGPTCASSSSITVNFDDGSAWGVDGNSASLSAECGSSDSTDGAWFIWIR